MKVFQPIYAQQINGTKTSQNVKKCYKRSKNMEINRYQYSKIMRLRIGHTSTTHQDLLELPKNHQRQL